MSAVRRVDELATQDQQGIEFQLIFRAFFGHRRLKAAGIHCQQMSVDPIALGQEALGLGEVPHPARLHAGNGQSSVQGGVEDGPLVAAGGFHDNQGGTQLPQAFDQLRDSRRIVDEDDNLGLALDGQIEFVFGDINAQIRHRRVHIGTGSHVGPFLQMRAWLQKNQRLSRLFGRETRDGLNHASRRP